MSSKFGDEIHYRDGKKVKKGVLIGRKGNTTLVKTKKGNVTVKSVEVLHHNEVKNIKDQTLKILIGVGAGVAISGIIIGLVAYYK